MTTVNQSIVLPCPWCGLSIQVPAGSNIETGGCSCGYSLGSALNKLPGDKITSTDQVVLNIINQSQREQAAAQQKANIQTTAENYKKAADAETADRPTIAPGPEIRGTDTTEQARLNELARQEREQREITQRAANQIAADRAKEIAEQASQSRLVPPVGPDVRGTTSQEQLAINMADQQRREIRDAQSKAAIQARQDEINAAAAFEAEAKRRGYKLIPLND